MKSRLLDSADAWGSSYDFGAGKLNIARTLGLYVPPITSVTIGGMSQVPPNESCTWWASVSGGTPPYTYNWYAQGNWQGSWSYVTVATGTSNFTLTLLVQDSRGKTGSANKAITVTSMAPDCFQ